MDHNSESHDLGMLCRGCDCSSYRLPDLDGLTEDEVKTIQELCRLCVDSFKRNAANG
uniref:Uncharacterized protein n=1 Tax=Geobacter sp. (strain M21) TaxID=443144 RepID=C6E6K4_GEOSM